jgi:hypothetical protein
VILVELASQARRELGAKIAKAARTGQSRGLTSHDPKKALQKLTDAIDLKDQGKYEGDLISQRAKRGSVVAKSMQFILRDGRDEADVLSVLADALGFIVESTDVKFEGALGFIQVDDFRSGFNQGHLVSWPDSVVWQGDAREVARKLAARLNTDVLLELDDESDQWLLTSPIGGQRVASVVMLHDGIDTTE